MGTKKRCFVISPIGEDDSPTRKDADVVLKHIIGPPVLAAGYEVVRADQIEKSGVITNQIIEYVLESELVVADLTGRNPNVFYELALRHAARKPLIQIIRKGEDLPFDVAAMRTISYELDLEGAERAKALISGFLSSSELASEVESPVSMAVDLYTNKDADNSTPNQLAKLRNEVGRILGEMQNISSAITFHDTDDVMEKLDAVSKQVEDLNRETNDLDSRVLDYYVSKGKKGSSYPDYMVMTRSANTLASDAPHISQQIRDCIDLEDGSIDEPRALVVLDNIDALLQDLEE